MNCEGSTNALFLTLPPTLYASSFSLHSSSSARSYASFYPYSESSFSLLFSLSVFFVSVFGSSFSFFVYTGSFPYSEVFGLLFGEIVFGVYLYVLSFLTLIDLLSERLGFPVSGFLFRIVLGFDAFKRDLSAFQG